MHTNSSYTSLQALVVDDYPAMNQTIKNMLSKLGFKKVYSASDGKEAMTVMEHHDIDLIISDWNMPKMNGLQLLQAIRKEEEKRHIPFIMLTANINQDDVIKAITSGVSEYLIKPFNTQALEEKISRAFSAPSSHKLTHQAFEPDEPIEISTDESPTKRPKKKHQNILIVDDEPNNITVLTELLKGKYNLQACLSGKKALEVCSKEPLPDLILLDIMMPNMDGLEVCQALKQELLTSQIPIIFISALSQTENIVKGLSLGAVDYITKPISPEITLARIATHLKLVKQRAEMVLQLDTLIENVRLKEDIERIMHHDLKNPLSVIQSAVHSLNHQEAYIKSDMDLITDSLHTLQKMLDQQMIIHQLENNSTTSKLSSLNALELFNKIAYGQKEKCVKQGVLVHYKIAKHITFMGNHLLSFNMFNNLLSNAIEASLENGEVEISVATQSHLVIFKIHNQGVISKEVQSRFFDKFITHGKPRGTGLGTYSAKLSALAQQGDIAFTSNENDGTTLIVTLKAVP